MLAYSLRNRPSQKSTSGSVRRDWRWATGIGTGVMFLFAATSSLSFAASGEKQPGIDTLGNAGAASQSEMPVPQAQTAPATENGNKSAARAAALEARRTKQGNLVGHGGPVKAIAVDAEQELAATGSFDYAMMIWNLKGDSPKAIFRFDAHGGAVNAVAFVTGTRLALAAGDDGALSAWNLDSGQRIHRFEGHTAKINHLAVSADGAFAVTSSWDRTARLWNLTELKAGPVLEGHGGPVNAAAFSADGTHVYTAGYDGVLRLFKREDGALVRPVYKHGWGLNVLARVPGSEKLIIGSLNGAALVIDGMDGSVVHEFKAFERPVLSVAVVEKPGLIALGAGEGSIKVARLADWAEIETYQNPFGPVWALAFAPGSTALYYGGLDDFATLWQISPRVPYETVESPFPRRFQVSGDPDDPIAKGELQFARKCSVCHTLQPDGRNRAGPTLYKIFGRRIASLPGYPYSKELTTLDIVWTEETVSELFALGPEVFTPGSKMPLQKMKDKAQRDALIAYLKVATQPADAAGKQHEGAAPDAGAPK
ncbi:MAG: c-type cytochrome [Hyphomicrobiaceae bacterium]|nr:c-type cytochrome [Hyphomicrobiaceae bacterium]